MELEEAENNLRAMRLLYRLLEHNSLGLQNTNSEDLVERAQELLKNMLEVASERVFETILKIIATESGIYKTPFTSQPVDSFQLRPLLAANNGSNCSIKYPTRSKFPSRKNEQPRSKSPAKKAGPRLSKCSISDKGKSIRKALFNNVGEESSIMQHNLEKPIFPIQESSNHREQQHSVSTFHVGKHSKQCPDTFASKASKLREETSETSLPYRVCEVESNPSASSSMVEAQHDEEEEDISSDLFNAIKRIESRILALQLYSSLAHSKKNDAGNKILNHKITNSESPIRQKSEGIAGNGTCYGKSLLEGNGSMNRQANQLVAGKVENQIAALQENDNGITAKRRSPKGEAFQNGFRPRARSMANECIQGIRIPLNSMTASPTNQDMTKPTRKRNPVAQSEIHRREKQPLHQMVPRQLKILPPHCYRDRKVLENRGIHKMRASSKHHHESEQEFSSSSSCSSPARLTSNQTSTIYSSCESEESIGDSLGKMVIKSYEDSSGEYSSDSHSQNDDAGSSPHRTGSSSSGRSWHNRRGPDKTDGRLRRLKNKLRLIFHHHHHLHHHHHHEDEDEDDSKMSKADHSHSIWKRIFHGKNKHKLPAKGRSGKTNGGTIVEMSHGKQVGHFHGLVEGFLRHIRHSKKRKPSNVVRIKGSRYPKRRNRKNFHWWQMLRCHRGVRLNNGGRLKVGFKSQKRLKS